MNIQSIHQWWISSIYSYIYTSIWKWKSPTLVHLFGSPWSIESMEFSRPEYWSGYSFPSPGDHPNPGIKPRSPMLQVDFLSAEPQRKPKDTRVGSLSLLQGIFPTQESNWDLLHCRWVLYQLSYQGSPYIHLYAYMHILWASPMAQ